jgi:polyhydroxyalkanoate synthesis regulator phasin
MARNRKQQSAEHAESLARKIWLAGLGAYGMSVEDAQGQLDKASQQASKLFNELVDKGTEIENQSRRAIHDRLAEARNRLSEKASSNVRPVEEMIQRVRERVSRDGDALAGMIGRLAGRRTQTAATGTTTRGVAAKPAAGTRKPARKPAATPAKRKHVAKPAAAKRGVRRR